MLGINKDVIKVGMVRYAGLIGIWMAWSVSIVVAQATCPNLLPSRLIVGEQARVIVVGGSNLRTTPGTTSDLLNIVPTDAVVRVVDGPFCGLSFAWWQAEYANQRGWLAEGADGQYWLEPFDPPTGRIGRVMVQATPDIATAFDTERLTDTTVLRPVDYPVSSPLEPRITVYDVPPRNNQIAKIQSVIVANDPALVEAPAAARQSIIRYVDGIGVRYVALNFDAENPDPTTITYEFRGISDNGRYVEATFPLDVTDLPFDYVPPPDADPATVQIYNDQYLQQTANTLTTLPASEFTPLLVQLDAMLQTLQTDAFPPDTGISLSYRDETLRLTYPDDVIANITVEAQAPDRLPFHLRYTLLPTQPDDDPANQPILRVYRTAELDSNWLARLQMIFSRGLANPPNLTTYETREAGIDEPALVRYLSFENGQGMRFVAAEQPAPVYYFQGITADNTHYVSMIWPTRTRQSTAISGLTPDQFAPDLDILDAIAETIEVVGR